MGKCGTYFCPSDGEYLEASLNKSIEPYAFDEDPDIAGIGVIASFFIYAVFTSGLAMITYIFVDGVVPKDFYNELDLLVQLKARRGLSSVWEVLIHRRVREYLDFLWPRRLRMIPKKKLQNVCLQLTDIQLVTGASIYIVLYSRDCTVSQYHFYVGLELSYLSFVTFQGMLLAVVDVLHDRLSRRVWRYLWILVIFAAILVSRFIEWNDYFMVDRMYGLSVQCTFDKLSISEHYTPTQAGILTLECGGLVWSLWSVTALLFPKIRKVFPFAQLIGLSYWNFSGPARELVRERDRAAEDPATDETTKFRIKQGMITMAFMITLTLREIVFSQVFDLLRVYTLLIGSIYGILYERGRAADHGRQGDEGQWGFGQILPLLLLALPISAVVEEIWGSDRLAAEGNENDQEDLVVDEHAGAVSLDSINGGQQLELGRNNTSSAAFRPSGSPSSAQPSEPAPAAISDTVLARLDPPARIHLDRARTFHQIEIRDAVFHTTLISRIRRPLEIIDDLERTQDKVDDLEQEWFNRDSFQHWMIACVSGMYLLSTYLVLVVGVPI